MTSARLDPRSGLRASLALALILVVALVLRLHHLGWALPHTYEEARPLHAAFQMWGWDRGIDVNLNPEFFNYPSLVLYVHFVVQGLVYLALKVGGGIQSVVDWQVLYLTDPSILYLVERAVTVVFAVASVWATAATARLVAGWPAALTAGLFLAVNAFHIARSRVIEVDMPCTFFVMLSLWAMVRIIQSGRRRDFILAGAAIGLATSCKYTGLLLVVPLVAASALAPRSSRSPVNLLRAAAVVVAVFALTSPYVLLNFGHFWRDLAVERAHMVEGHFGLAQSSTWNVYTKSLANGALNPLGALAALVGMAAVVRRRDRAGAVLIVFAVAYFVVISTWTMRADRYLLPLIPVLLVLAGVAVAGLAKRSKRVGVVAAVLVVALSVGIDLQRHAAAAIAIQSDGRTDAARWIEANVAAGAFIVTEHQGPEFLLPATLLQLNPDLRERVQAHEPLRKIYAVQMIPMTQTNPESSAPFYSLRLYPEADFVVTSSGVRDRYERDPGRFAPQLAFYADLEATFERAGEFVPAGDSGVRVTIYRRVSQAPPFAARDSIAPPPVLPAGSGGRAAAFYFEMGTNYEFFGHEHEAYVCYVRALDRLPENGSVFIHCVLGAVRTLLATGQSGSVTRLLDRVSGAAPDDETRRLVDDLRLRFEG